MDKIRVWFAGNSAGLKSESHQLVANDAAFEWVGKSDQSTPALAAFAKRTQTCWCSILMCVTVACIPLCVSYSQRRPRCTLWHSTRQTNAWSCICFETGCKSTFHAASWQPNWRVPFKLWLKAMCFCVPPPAMRCLTNIANIPSRAKPIQIKSSGSVIGRLCTFI